MRFDDSLKTIMSADMASGSGAEAAWRQLVDLAGRGRIAVDEPVIARLRLLRQAVSDPVRRATARALAFAAPGPALVGLFAEDDLAIAAPVLRTASIPSADWLAILPRMSPEGRSVLRHRRDLPAEVVRGLESFGATDFVLPYEGDEAVGVAVATVSPPPANDRDDAPSVSSVGPTTVPPNTPRSATPFVAVGDIARDLPMVAEALSRAAPVSNPPTTETPAAGRFEIADLVQRIDAFNRDRGSDRGSMVATPPPPATSFRFQTDATGTIKWVDGVQRAAIVGVSIAHAVRQGEVGVDAAMSGAWRQRARFEGARFDIGGRSDAAGEWRVAAEPEFDQATGRFTGFRGIARRPRPDEDAAAGARAASDSLRQLVHELRTPANAIAGFAELIETQLLGPVEPVYRGHAQVIRDQADRLMAAIDDLDTAARIEGRALELRAVSIPLDAAIAHIARELEPLTDLRRVTLRIEPFGATVMADDRALDRLLSRLIAALVAVSKPGDVVTIGNVAVPGAMIGLGFSRPEALRPGALGTDGEDALLSLGEDSGDDSAASLLGTGFALRLARNLAVELGGALDLSGTRLTLTLPAADADKVARAGN